MAINKLTHPVLRAAKPRQTPYKLGDGGGGGLNLAGQLKLPL